MIKAFLKTLKLRENIYDFVEKEILKNNYLVFYPKKINIYK
jgi:hypothetical protein